MNKQIEEYLKINSFDADTRWGVVNEGENLKRALAACGNDETQFLRDIEIYSFYAFNGNIRFNLECSRTFINEGKFSFYNSDEHYTSYLFDGYGGTITLTYRDMYEHKPSVWFTETPPAAHGKLYFFTDTPSTVKHIVMKSVEGDILSMCREHFGYWPEQTDRNAQERNDRQAGLHRRR